MKCIDKNIILDYLNDELSSHKKKLITEHLSECAHCRHEVEEWKKVLNLTQHYVENDIKTNPVPPHAHITQRFEHLPQKEHAPLWRWSWAKPVIVTATACIAVLIMFTSVLRTPQTQQENYYIIDNGSYTEAVTVSDVYLSNLESMYLEEIYSNEDLTHDILYGDWQYYEEVLDDLDQSEFEELIDKMYDNDIT